jgi:hypothetical protein
VSSVDLEISSGATLSILVVEKEHLFRVSLGSSMEIKSFRRSSDEPIYVRAVQDYGFKKCCMKSGRDYGGRRNYFFPRVEAVNPARGVYPRSVTVVTASSAKKRCWWRGHGMDDATTIVPTAMAVNFRGA